MDRREKAALWSVVINLVLVAIKAVAAMLSGSLALVADAWHSTSDIFVSLLVFAGIRISKKQKVWLNRVENLVALIIGGLILYTAIEIFLKVGARTAEGLTNPAVAIGAVLACIVISYCLARYKVNVGKQEDSPSLRADGYHSRADMFSSIVVLVGIVGQMIGLKLDGVAAVVVAFMVAKTGVEILIAAVGGLDAKKAFSYGTLYRIERTSLGRLIAGLRGVFLKLGLARAFTVVALLTLAAGRRWKTVLAILVVAALCAYMLSGFYTVGPGQTGLVQRFGRLLPAPSKPGLNWCLPYPLEKVTVFAPNHVYRVETGFRTVGLKPGEEEPDAYLWETMHLTGKYRKNFEEALMLTGDENIADVNTTVQYTVSDPAKYLFATSEAEKLVRDAALHSIREVVGTTTLDSILTLGREKMLMDIRNILQAILDSYDCGIRVEAVYLQDVHPPIEVVSAFRDVASAREEKSISINRELGYQYEVLPEARGQAYADLVSAQTYKETKTVLSAGEAQRFLAKQAQYEKAKQVTEWITLIEMAEKSLASPEKVIVCPRVESSRFRVGEMFLFGKFLKGLVKPAVPVEKLEEEEW